MLADYMHAKHMDPEITKKTVQASWMKLGI